LQDKIAAKGIPISFPQPQAAGTRGLHFSALHDVSLALTMEIRVVGNTLDTDGKSLVIITGANQGGKSSFLRSIGVAQLMMQCGMFVAAESFVAELCADLFTHYKREEDATMKSGKLDEELGRMSGISICRVGPTSVKTDHGFRTTKGYCRRTRLSAKTTDSALFPVTKLRTSIRSSSRPSTSISRHNALSHDHHFRRFACPHRLVSAAFFRRRNIS
jgi:hypothetical protein